jgi:hypothetical protein
MRVLSLGGGQQSTAVYLLAATGEIPKIDHAIFADTKEEPRWVYDQILSLNRFPGGAPILWRGKDVGLGDMLVSTDGGRFASIPAFVKRSDRFYKRRPDQGKRRRQCAREFKIEVIERTIRYELLGLKPGQVYRGERFTQIIGYDADEGGRIVDMQARLAEGRLAVGEFPLWEMGWNRAKCIEYVERILGHEVLPSACTFCPLVSDRFRRLVRDRDPAGWKRACEIDEGMRAAGAAANRELAGESYVHRSMKPLAEADIDKDGELMDFSPGCEGYCGH